ncbi:hypothetical protein DQ04_00031200 [Trypanosoma grayi]|uniref:hypothetical protein n=1 Tax=Trypanosoma grayi TaxID=71804 RepID=UPI0004F46420|nr:hypothetical protein DQ04_00031200 [Trypanosoma grayi]KEG15586.1 hypothetical protein DQ04_00031200 [Trypanosoma grayi]
MAGLRHGRWVLLFAGLGAVLPVAAVYYRLAWRRGPRGTAGGPSGSSSSTMGACTRDSEEEKDAAALGDNERQNYHAALRQLKDRANMHFQSGRFEEALETYQGCLDVCAALGAADKEAVQVNQIVRSNVVLVFLKLQRPEEARMVATFLLQDEMTPVEGELKVKVLYRRGKASQELGDRESALCDFRAAIICSPDGKNPAAEREIEALSRN